MNETLRIADTGNNATEWDSLAAEKTSEEECIDDILDSRGARELFERGGVKLKANYYYQKTYGKFLEKVSPEEFRELAGDMGYMHPEEVYDMIDDIQNHKTYEVKKICMLKQPEMTGQNFVVISQPHSDYVIKKSSVPKKWQIVLSRDDQKMGGVLFSEGDKIERM